MRPMLKDEHKQLLPYDLYVMIEEICKTMNEISSEATGIASATNVPDSTAHLNDVIKHSEKATISIIDAVTAIQTFVDAGGADVSAKVGEEITKIFEACNFQDIGSQRILKVMKNLSSLEARLTRLAELAKGYGVAPPPSGAIASSGDSPPLDGPQLMDDAPSQADIDKLFGG